LAGPIIFGSFIADSAYDHLYLGNFFDTAHTDTIMDAPLTLGAYYFIDDVCVSSDSVFAFNWTPVHEVESEDPIWLYPNPSTGRIYIESNELCQMRVSVYDTFGREVVTSVFI
jgi:hypothetical protein